MELSIIKYLDLKFLVKNEQGEIIYPTDKEEINNINKILKHERIGDEIYDKDSNKWYSYINKTQVSNGIVYQLEIISDITKHKKYSIDYTTKLFNKDVIFKKLENVVVDDCPLYSIVIADIDFFKNVNDKYGHMVGDEVLYRIGKIIESNLDENSIAGRFGGEEFIIIVKNLSFAETYVMIEKIRDEVERMKFYFEKEHIKDITMSFGIYYNYGKSLDNYDTIKGKMNHILTKADNELYRSKNNGRNQINFYIEKSV